MTVAPPGDAPRDASKPEQTQPVPVPDPGESNSLAARDTPNAAKLSGAALKAKAKADKAARRAQAKATKETAKGEAAISSVPQQLGPSAGEVKKSKAKAEIVPATAHGFPSRPPPSKAPPSAAVVEAKSTTPECFSHLSMARRIPMTLAADKDVHPAVLTLGQQMAAFAIDESIARLKATLLAFKKVIRDYTTPPGATLSRHFTPHVLNPQIDYLTASRPMCFSMGNAIRWLKLQVSKIDVDLSEEEAKKELCGKVDNFVQERMRVADLVIIKAGAEHIQDGDVVLTYGRGTIVERTILYAKSKGRKFSVFVIDDPYERKGQILAKRLNGEGVKVSYCGDLGGLGPILNGASKVVLAAEAMFSNGSLYARTGSCDVAMAAKELQKPVIALCESINITERVATDSMTYNEIDPERCSASSFRLLFDTTSAKYLSIIVTELGTVQPTSAPDLLTKLEEFN